jgi:hypothetical protein
VLVFLTLSPFFTSSSIWLIGSLYDCASLKVLDLYLFFISFFAFLI